MTMFTQSQMKRLTAVHGWSGMILGLLLYAVVVTGVVVVFADEIGNWSQGGSKPPPLQSSIDIPVRSAIEPLTKGYKEKIFIFPSPAGDLMVFSSVRVRDPATGEQRSYGPLFRFDAKSGNQRARHEGFLGDHPEWLQSNGLERFLVHLHEELHMPPPWGMIVVGILGLLSMFAGVSGLILHRHLIRDLFVPERWGSRLVSFRDRHVLASSWSLPFAFLLGFTGAYLSFSETVIFPLLAKSAFGGDQDRMTLALFEPKTTPDPTPAQIANLDSIIDDATVRAGAKPRFISIDRWGRMDARIHIFHQPPTGQINAIQTIYNGATGTFINFRAPVGNAPSVGGTLQGLMGPLHFGDFAGVLSKSVWVGLGSAMAFVVISGLRLWVRRREEEVLWQRFGRAVTIVGYGLPVAMLMCAYAYFLALGAGADEFWWTPAGFLIGLAPGVVPGFVARDEDSLRRFYRLLLGIGLILLPVVRMATGGLDWAAAVAQGQGTVLSVDLTLLFLGAGLVWWARRMRALPASEPAPAE